MSSNKKPRRFALAARRACLAAIWLVLGGVVARQCEMDDIRNRVRALDERLHRIESQPTVKVTVGEDGRTEISDDTESDD